MEKLAQQYPDAHGDIWEMGFPNLARMMEIFARQVDMDRALGTSGAVSNWCRRKNAPGQLYERRAEKYLDDLAAPPSLQAAAVESRIVKSAPAAPSEATLLVVVKGDPAKLMRVLDLMGCEAVAI